MAAVERSELQQVCDTDDTISPARNTSGTRPVATGSIVRRPICGSSTIVFE